MTKNSKTLKTIQSKRDNINNNIKSMQSKKNKICNMIFFVYVLGLGKQNLTKAKIFIFI